MLPACCRPQETTAPGADAGFVCTSTNFAHSYELLPDHEMHCGDSSQVLLEFAIDDTAGGDNEDALTEIGFFVPKEATGFQDAEEHPAKVRNARRKLTRGAYLWLSFMSE